MISAIIPTYNRATQVTRAVASVLAQTYTDIEIIVVDDGSTDDTEEAMARYTGQITYLKIPHQGHPGVSRNAGLLAAHGEFVAFLDDDDEWLPDKLQKQMNAIAEFPSAGFICANAYRHNSSHTRSLYFGKRNDLSGWLFSELLYENFVIASSMLVRRSLFKDAGIFNVQAWTRGIEDYHLWLRAAACAPGVYLAEPLVVYYDASVTSIRGTHKLMEYWHNLYRIVVHAERFARQQKYPLTMETKALLLDRKRRYIDCALQEAISGRLHFSIFWFKLLHFYWSNIISHLSPHTR